MPAMKPLISSSVMLAAFSLVLLGACSDDGETSSTDDADASSTMGGDGDGDPATAGDGDSDSATNGDGDGDDPSTSGDGDGDDPSTSGDGDGDDPSTSGDGDGDDPSTSGDGDGDPGDGCPDLVVSFAADIEPMLDSGCAGMGCHSVPAPSAGLNLSSGQSYDALVGVSSNQCNDRLLVAPGDPGASYLVDKLRNIDLCFGTLMPKGGAAWSEEDIQAVEAWICDGAPEN